MGEEEGGRRRWSWRIKRLGEGKIIPLFSHFDCTVDLEKKSGERQLD